MEAVATGITKSGETMKVIISAISYVFLFLGLAFLIMSTAGCAVIKVETPEWSVSAMSLFKAVHIPKVTKGDLTVEGYRGKVDGEVLGEIIGTAVKAAK